MIDNVPRPAALGMRLRINGLTPFEAEFQEFIHDRYRHANRPDRMDELSSPGQKSNLQVVLHGLMHFRMMPLNDLLVLFRQIRSESRGDHWDLLAQAFLSRYDGWFYPYFIRHEEPLDLRRQEWPIPGQWVDDINFQKECQVLFIKLSSQQPVTTDGGSVASAC